MAADPMRIRAAIKDGKVEAKILMSHPMDTGLVKAADGSAIPAHYIQQVTATFKGKVVLSADWGLSISKNPYLAFRFSGGAKGDKLTVVWTDNKGQTRSDEGVIA